MTDSCGWSREPWAKPHHITHARRVYVHLPFKPVHPVLSAGRETKGQEECEEGPVRALRKEAAKASWSGFDLRGQSETKEEEV